ncbi:hypothetical protein ELE36_14675 [Pseudolysobacter antarcticus]|uniref:Uncharacterized protein n=1 Tax=Pseudolysobacter antarcticus TaxID=2511995 RepID=A0A411HLU3_9GAMM|nr:hypothetical protein [Pseudolysobacter antarcticus]QBB71499.1 hypothetical protein ELE36_14675 [Pseudolysobacter antarcticus]
MRVIFALLFSFVLLWNIQTVHAQTDAAPTNAVTQSCTQSADQNSSYSPTAVVQIDDRNVFDGNYPNAQRISFDSVAGATAPFKVNNVEFLGGGLEPQVLNSLVDLPASFWFGARTTSANFLLTNLAVQIKFPRDITAMGIDMQCLGCDNQGQATPMGAILLNDRGEMVSYMPNFPSTLTGQPSSTPGFVGFVADRPFRSIMFQRNGNWMLANVRYVPAPIASHCSCAPNCLSISGQVPALEGRGKADLR